MLQQIRIDVRLPEGHWAGDVTRAHPSATLRIEEQMAMTKGRGTATCWCDEILENSLLLHEGIDDYLGTYREFMARKKIDHLDTEQSLQNNRANKKKKKKSTGK